MYVLVVCFLVISFIFIVIGKSFVLYFDTNTKDNYSATDSFFIGLCLTGTVLNIWSLFLPTDFFALLFLILLTAFLFYRNSGYFIPKVKALFHRIKSEKLFSLLLLVATAILLLFAIIIPKNFDTFLYHVNAIQWNEMYRVVPGLANFHDRFGFNSSMMVLSAAFSFNAVYNQYIFAISSVSFLVFFFWLLRHIYFRKGAIGIMALLFLYFFTQQYGSDISSPSTDLLPNILVGFVLLSLLFENNSLQKKFLLYSIIPLFSLTLKLSIFPIAFLGLAVLLNDFKNVVPRLKSLILLGSFVLIPWLIRNVILTGYLVFPMDQLHLFNFDWTVPKEIISETTKGIYSWARIPHRDFNEVLAMSFQEWFPIWWKAVVPHNRFLFILAALAPVSAVIYFFTRGKEVKKIGLLVTGIAFSGFLLWLFTAPDFRFSFSFILVLAFFPVLILQPLIEKFKVVFNPLLIVSLLFSFYMIYQSAYTLFWEDFRRGKDMTLFYLPADIYYVKKKRNIKFDSHILLTPEQKQIEVFEPNPNHYQCYDKFPCTWFFNSNIKLRGEDLQSGFKY